MTATFLIQDPHHEYAVRFIELMYEKHGHRAICFFTDRKRRIYEADAYSLARSKAVAAICDVPREDLCSFATRTAALQDVVAVIPYNEECVLSAAEMSHAIGIRWNDTEVMRRFQDKFVLKDYLRRVEPSLRMNASFAVRDVDDIMGAARHFSRYVLKPRGGFGNRNVAFFDRATPRGEVAAFIERSSARPLVFEEYVGGREFFVNGQTGPRGEVEIVAIFRYSRVAANGRENLDHQAHLVRRDDPVFAGLADYATRVIRATGLVRSPFHLEAKVDDRGPCLIEVGARLAGLGNAFVCNALHGNAIDVFDVAAHYYVSDKDYGPLRLQWDVYDSMDVRYVSGIAHAGELTGDTRGVATVERLPSFHAWAKKPSIGKNAEATVCCLSMPWSVVLLAPAGTGLDADEAIVRGALTRPVSPLSPRVAPERVKRFARHLRRALSWQLERLVPPLQDPAAAVPRGPIAWVLRGTRGHSAHDRIVKKLQEAGIGCRYEGRMQATTPKDIEVSAKMLEWARTYLARPNRDLGRNGPVCLFVAKTLASNGFLFAVHEEADGTASQLRDIVLSHARDFERRYPASHYDSRASLLIVLPNVPAAALPVLDTIQDETKTYLMKRKMMVAAVHPESARPAINNPSFPVLRSPVPCFALRHMVVQDIVFLDHNREAVVTYDKLFGSVFAQGKVSNEFGYVDRYKAALARFGDHEGGDPNAPAGAWESVIRRLFR